MQNLYRVSCNKFLKITFILQPEYLEDEINDYKNEKIWELMGKY